MKTALTPTSEMYCSACEHTYPTGSEVCPRDGTRLIKLVGQRDPFLGRDLDGRYVILDKLGQGGMGAVYRGNQRSVDRDVAIKVVNPHLVADPEMIKRFLREARLASRLNHPNAVGVVDFGQTSDGVFYLVMELVAGRTLEKILDDEGRLDPDRTALIGAQICHALEGAHAIPIVHRDLKPANVLVDANDFVKVLDFGLAKSLSLDTISSTMTSAGRVMGTPNFMPPEIAMARPSDERADLYALGCILYYAASGRLPFGADSLVEIMRMHAHDPPPPLPEVPADLAAVILRLLAKKPSDRYPTATATRLALEATIEGDHAPPTPWTDGATIPMPVRRGGDEELDVSTVPRRARAIHERDTLRPASRGRSWPWVAAAVVAAAGIAAFLAIDPLGDPDPRAAGTAPSVPVVAPAAVKPPIVTTEPATSKAPEPKSEPEPEPEPEPEIEMPAISAKPTTAKPQTAKPQRKPPVKPERAPDEPRKPPVKPERAPDEPRKPPVKPARPPEEPPPPF